MHCTKTSTMIFFRLCRVISEHQYIAKRLEVGELTSINYTVQYTYSIRLFESNFATFRYFSNLDRQIPANKNSFNAASHMYFERNCYTGYLSIAGLQILIVYFALNIDWLIKRYDLSANCKSFLLPALGGNGSSAAVQHILRLCP